MSAPLTPSSYWHETRRPLVNLAFVAPLLLLYEVGVWWAGGGLTSVRNGADEWLRAGLAGFGGTLDWLLPVTMIGLFLAWHIGRQESWKLRVETLGGMSAESLLYACLLILIGQAADGWMRTGDAGPLSMTPGAVPWTGIRLVHFLGAGLYEEFLFRLCLVPAAYLVLRILLVPRRWSLWGSVLATSVVFSLAHYLPPTSDATLLSVFSDAVSRVQSSRELWFGFTFRLLAGGMFGILFVWRGFGIAVGCHAAYDVGVGIVLVSDL